jgi:tyrosyl-tRNA synthetase
MPTEEIGEEALTDGAIGIIDLLVAAGLAASKGEARRLIQQGGVTVDGEKVEGFDKLITKEELVSSVKLRKGKKVYKKVVLKK